MAFKLGNDTAIDESGVIASPWTGATPVADIQSTKLTILPPIPTNTGLFGRSVACGHNMLVVGAPGEDSLNGKIYTFDFQGNELNNLSVHSNSNQDDAQFGLSVAIGEGLIIAGSPYEDENPNQRRTGTISVTDLELNVLNTISHPNGTLNENENAEFGYSVAVGDGRIVVGAPRDNDRAVVGPEGAAYVFDLDGNLLHRLVNEFPYVQGLFGFSVAVGYGRIVVGNPSFQSDVEGSVTIFDLEGNQIKRISGESDGDKFGWSVSVGQGLIAVGARNRIASGFTNREFGKIYLYDLDGNEIATSPGDGLQSYDQLGADVAIGAGKVFGGAWQGEIGSDNLTGTVHIYGREVDQYGEVNFLTEINSGSTQIQQYFGAALATGDGKLVVGAYGKNSGGFNQAGEVFVYDIGTTQDDYWESVAGL